MRIPAKLSRREVASNRFFTYAVETLAAAHGPYDYHLIEARFDAVIAVPVLADGRLVVERIYRHPYGRVFHEFPAGGIDPGEEPCAAAARELAEETGWRASSTRLLGSFEPMPGLVRMRLHVVLAGGLEPGAPSCDDPMELIETELMDEAAAWREADSQPASSFLVHGLLYLERDRRRRATTSD
jgi:ADP-ribose pyrophosphatase